MTDNYISNQNSDFSIEISTNKNNYSKLSNTEEDFNNLVNNKNNNINYIFSYTNFTNFTLNFKNLITRSKLGNTYSFLNDKNDNPFIIIGPQWYFYPLIFILFSFIFFYYVKYFDDFIILKLKYLRYIFYFLWVISYTISVFANPGYPKINNNSVQGNNNMIYCQICEIWSIRKDNVYHCHICDICVEEWEFHSKLIGGCVGKGNKKSFFVCSIMFFIILLYMIIGLGIKLKDLL